MNLGNKPESGALLKEGKVYWWLSVGRTALSNRYLDNGWRGVEFVVFKPYQKRENDGGAYPTIIKISFAFWLPFQII